MTLNVLLVVTFSLLPNPWNNLDDLWTKSVESPGWYNPVWDKVPLFRPRPETSCHTSQCDLEFHWTRLPSDEPVRAGWVLHDGEVGWLVRNTGQWLLTLRLTPRCSCGRKGLCVCVYIYIYIFFFFFLSFVNHVSRAGSLAERSSQEARDSNICKFNQCLLVTSFETWEKALASSLKTQTHTQILLCKLLNSHALDKMTSVFILPFYLIQILKCICIWEYGSKSCFKRDYGSLLEFETTLLQRKRGQSNRKPDKFCLFFFFFLFSEL